MRSGGVPAWAVVLGLVAVLGAGAWLVQTGGSPLRSRRLSSLTDYLDSVRIDSAPFGGGAPVGLAPERAQSAPRGEPGPYQPEAVREPGDVYALVNGCHDATP